METAKLVLRKATPDDLKEDRKTLKYGLPFWVRSKETGEFDNNCQIINEDTDVIELMEWLANDMIYVLAGSLEALEVPDRARDDNEKLNLNSKSNLK